MNDSMSDNMNSGHNEKNMASRWLVIVGLIVGIGAAVWLTLPEPPGSVQKGSQTAEFSLPDLAGTLQSLPKGEVVLLNFWATWCPPCRKEIPSMAQLHDKYAADGLKIIAISVDKRSADLARFVSQYRMPFQVLHDADGTVSRRYGVFRYPESFLVDRDGKVVHHLSGEVDWMSASVTQTVETMLSTVSANNAK